VITDHRDALDATRLGVVVDRVVLRDAVVPHADGALGPAIAAGELRLLRERVQVVEQRGTCGAVELRDAIRERAKATTGTVERTSLYQLLGRTKDEALARRALDLALTDEPGKTISSGMISTVAGQHPRLAIDFVLSHLAQVNELIDISGRSRFMQRLATSSRDPELIPILESYAKASLAESDRKPIQQAIDRIRYESAQAQRIRMETAAWLAAHP